MSDQMEEMNSRFERWFHHALQSPSLRKAVNYYESLSNNEQRALRFLSIFLFLVIVVFVLIMPSLNYSAKARENYVTATETLSWMQANKENAAIAASLNVHNSGESLLAIVTKEAKRTGIVFDRYESQGDKLVLWLDNTEFNNLLRWLTELRQNHSATITDVNIDALEQSGRVNVRLVLQG